MSAGWRILALAVGLAVVVLVAEGVMPARMAAKAAGAQEHPASSREPHSFRYLYMFEPKGWRYWVRETPFTWTESYADGRVSHFNVIGRIQVEGDDGIMLQKDENTYAFVPDRGSRTMWVRFGAAPNEWSLLNEMKAVR